MYYSARNVRCIATNRKSIEKKPPYFLPSVQVYQDMQISVWYVLLVCLINMFFFAVWRSTEALTIHQIMSAAV